jgi:hypothetical protein
VVDANASETLKPVIARGVNRDDIHAFLDERYEGQKELAVKTVLVQIVWMPI